jgi:hypothetical protein
MVMVLVLSLHQPVGGPLHSTQEQQQQHILKDQDLAMSPRSLVPELLPQEVPMQTKSMSQPVHPLVQPLKPLLLALVLLPLTMVPLMQVHSACSMLP